MATSEKKNDVVVLVITLLGVFGTVVVIAVAVVALLTVGNECRCFNKTAV